MVKGMICNISSCNNTATRHLIVSNTRIQYYYIIASLLSVSLNIIITIHVLKSHFNNEILHIGGRGGKKSPINGQNWTRDIYSITAGNPRSITHTFIMNFPLYISEACLHFASTQPMEKYISNFKTSNFPDFSKRSV